MVQLYIKKILHVPDLVNFGANGFYADYSALTHGDVGGVGFAVSDCWAGMGYALRLEIGAHPGVPPCPTDYSWAVCAYDWGYCCVTHQAHPGAHPWVGVGCIGA